MMRRLAVVLVALSLTAAASQAADSGFESVSSSFQPRVPVSLLSGLGNLGSLIDPSRLHISNTVTVGSGTGYGTSALNVTSFSYQFRSPLSLSVSVGNNLGTGSIGSSPNAAFFLEGLNLTYKPTTNSEFRVQFQNVRSPLQYGYGSPERAFWGY